MTHESVRQILDRAKDSGLLSGEQFSSLDSLVTSTDDTQESLADRIVADGLLTPYQADRLLAGDAQSLLIQQRYEIQQQIGAGGMGEVFRAYDRQLNRDVAVKVLPQHMVRDSGAVARFQREAKAMAQLSHINIVQAHDSGSEGEQHFLVMELVEGVSLAQLLQQKGRLDAMVAADYGYQAALGLAHAHKKGLVHRDLKPSNLLIVNNRCVKVLDLGLARFLQDQIHDDTLTLAGVALGTPDYMAPEQFDSARDADERSDVYSLGCTLYHMLTGIVPFPGSSLTEKRQEHQYSEPPPISCPGVPAGLAQVVYKMMSKKPADRFESAQACAEALTPYVDVSSSSLPNLKATIDWDGSLMTIVTAERRRHRALKWGAQLTLLVLLAGVSGFVISRLGTRGPAPTGDSLVAGSDPRIAETAKKAKTNARNDNADTGKDKKKKKKATKATKTAKPSPPLTDQWVIGVAQDGTAQFKTIGAALKHLEDHGLSGRVIQVRDTATYREQLKITKHHRGLSLVSDYGATLENGSPGTPIITLTDATEFTIRGFKLHPTDKLQTGVSIRGEFDRIRLDRLELRSTKQQGANGVEVYGGNSDSQHPSLVIADCSFQNLFSAIRVVGDDYEKKTPLPVYGLLIKGNSFTGNRNGIVCRKGVRRGHIVANRFSGSLAAAVQLQQLADDSGPVLIANNTFFENRVAVRLWDSKVASAEVQVRNNLVIAPTLTDFVFIDNSGGDQNKGKPGDIEALLKQWTFDHNWRETKRPTGNDVVSHSWIKPAPNDVVRDKIDELSRDKAKVDFLRPLANSALADNGAGVTDPLLPRYVGAAPPAGRLAWDWDRCWRTPPGKYKVLTVSKSPQSRGKYRTVNAALQDSGPWDRIRILDNAVYPESIRISSAQRHRGLALESPQSATLELREGDTAVKIQNVPEVVVSGLRLRKIDNVDLSLGRKFISFVEIDGNCANGQVIGLKISTEANRNRAQENSTGIYFNSSNNPLDRPFTVTNCQIQMSYYGIIVSGLRGFSSAVRVEGNRIRAKKGIGIDFRARNSLFAGNLIWGGDFANIELRDALVASRNLVFANNTLHQGTNSFRMWQSFSQTGLAGTLTEMKFVKGQVALQNNVLANASIGDLVVVKVGSNQQANTVAAPQMSKTWALGGNYRDLSGLGLTPIIALHKTDQKLPSDAFESTTSDDENFLRPKPKSPLLSGGVGGDLPKYAGALPPSGVAAWNWDVTWRSRVLRARHRTTNGSTDKGTSP